MAEVYKEQALNKEFPKLRFEDRFSLLVDLEFPVVRAIRFINQTLLSIRIIEEIEYYENERFEKDLIFKLASGTYILDNHNIILKEPTSSGKSYLASAFEVSACG